MHIMKDLEGLTCTFVRDHCCQQVMQFLKEFGIYLTPVGYVLQTSYACRTFIDKMEVYQETKLFFQSGKLIPFCLQ